MHAVSTLHSGSDLPRSFGRYTLFDLIGKGGMAQIYLARAETELGATRLAVVKEILPAFADDPRFAEMLIHEAKLAARLSHRHIVQVIELGRVGEDDRRASEASEEHDGHLFIAMEYVEGFDLNALLRLCTENKVPLPAPHALGIVLDVLEGLDYAHRRADDQGVPLGIVHRDVSPSNILISYEGEVKLCDFGIAHANDLVTTGNEALKGKAGYMSPEHARGEDIDARADVFAAGIILWELLAGRRLYRPKSEIPLLDQARAAEIPALPDKGLPEHARLEAIVRKALAKDANERYASAAAFARDLEGYLAEHGLLASRLKLGEWMASTFGTKIVEDRRASERRLPKSNPPPRSSERVRTNAAGASSAIIPAAPPVPRDLALEGSLGAQKAFKKDLDERARRARSLEELTPSAPLPGLPLDPGSLVGTEMDVPPSSTSVTDERGPRDSAAPSKPLAKPRTSSALLALYVAIGIALGLGLVALARVLVH